VKRKYINKKAVVFLCVMLVAALLLKLFTPYTGIAAFLARVSLTAVLVAFFVRRQLDKKTV